MNMRRTLKQMSKKVRILSSVYLFTLLPVFANAQTTFTQRIQQEAKGEGTLTMTHSQTIDNLVNSLKTGGNQKQTDEKTATKERKTDTHVFVERDSTSTDPIDTRKKVMRGGYKVNGYRVQAFAGGNSRKDRQMAEQTRNTIKSHYPSEPIYVHFYSPRWICRVGNYRTYEEAQQMLLNIRKLGISGASIIKAKISVAY